MAEVKNKSVERPSRSDLAPAHDPPKAPPKTPRQRFVSLGPKRINRFVSVCAMLKRFGNKSQYELTEQERIRLIKLVNDESLAVVRAIQGEKAKTNGFTLDPPTTS